MKVAIAYYSQHHGNTKKLLDTISEKHEVTLIDVTTKHEYDLRDFDLIGFASGVYYGKLAKQLISFAQKEMDCAVKFYEGLIKEAE